MSHTRPHRTWFQRPGGGYVTIVANDLRQPPETSRDPVFTIYRRLRPRLVVAHGVAYAAVLLTGGIVAMALGHFGIGLAALLLSAPSALLALKAWLVSGRSGPLDQDPN